METETTLVDYSYGSSSPRTAPFRTSDVDFRDVFGGPPRRSSIHEMMRYSFTEGADPLAAGRRMGEMPSFRDPWTGAEEKPVFGGGVEGGNRRRDLREDFFVDIFGGGESPTPTTPRKHDVDVFSSSPPASRPLSPAWPLPPRAEGFGCPSSVPTQFSLPGKLSNSVDSTPFGSPSRTSYKDTASNGTSRPHSPKISVFGFSSRSVQVHDESRSTGAHYRPSPLSRQFSLGKENSLGSNKDENSVDLEKEMGNPQDVTSSPQFHFSIYKWASKGIPIMMPLTRARSRRSQEKGRTGSPIFNETTEASDEVENQSPGNFSSKVELEARQPAENEVPSSQKLEALGPGWNNNVEDIPVISVPEDKDRKSSSLYLANSRESLEKEMNGGLSRPELKPLHAFFHDKDEEQGNNEDAIDGKPSGAGRVERSSKGSSGKDKNIKVFKKSDEELLVRKSEEAKKVVSKGSPRNSEDGTGKKRSKGKVKEFIKIFSQESSPAKPKASVHPQSQSFTKEERGTPVATLEANSHKNSMINERISVSQLEKPGYDSNKVADPHKEPPEEHSSMDNADILFSDTSSGRKDNSPSSTESATDEMRATDEDADESFRAYFTIKELPQDENKQQPTEDREEIQALDAKIRQWSRGKEGNIRSLLSTLQYVLWPGSGWKPVPLVDIIEGHAVKRAYQRALLCLHPDKLQQKGAALEQKYIAEKVFDILQESWTHFNTIGAM